MARRAILVTTVCFFLASPASGVTRPPITERDSGKTFVVRLGRGLTLRLSERYRWTGPRVQGTAIRLVPVNYIRDPGFQEWLVRAKAPGTARITAVGYSVGAPRHFRVAVVVR